MEFWNRLTKVLMEKCTPSRKVAVDDLETELQYKERWISIYIIYFTMFLISLGFSVVITGVWPYLDKLDPTAGKEFMGYIVAANPLGQMLFSPLVGWWSNKLGSIRIPLLASLCIFTISSGIYSSLELFSDYRKHWMLWTRFLVGVSSANVAACRSYLSAATRFSERTKAVSMISLAQVLGFVIGPAIQAVVVPLGNDGVWLIPGKLQLNMYTAAGWINVFLALLNIVLFFPPFFKEHRIAAREAMIKQGKDTEEDTWKHHKLDYLAVWTMVVAFFVICFNFMLLETLGSPLTMDQFAWSKQEALYYMGLLMSVGAITACATFVGINPLCKWFPEVQVMIWGGFFFMVLGRAVYIPYSEPPPRMYNDSLILSGANYTICDKQVNNDANSLMYTNLAGNLTMYTESCINETELVGCPTSQQWCEYTPAMTIFQFVLGYILTVLGYPIGVTLIQTIFSKILGPRPQGVWMGLMTGSGCMSRVMGPIFVTYIYTQFGTVWTFGLTTVMMIVSLLWLCFFAKRLMPTEEQALAEEETNKFVSVALEDK